MKSSVHSGSQFISHPDFSPTSVKERQILVSVLRSGAKSQAQIGRETGTPQQSVSRLVNGLFKRGALKTGARIDSGKRGQQSLMIELVADFAYAFGVSIMNDSVCVSLMDFSGRVLCERHLYMSSITQQHITDEAGKIIYQLTQEYISDPSRIFGIGVGISGYFFEHGSKINTPGLSDGKALMDIENILSERMQLPVWVDSDGNAAAIGESLVGVGRRTDNFVYLYIAADLNGGVVIDGDLIRGIQGNAGDLALLLPEQHFPQPTLELLRQELIKHGADIPDVSALIARFDPEWAGIDEWVAGTRESLSLIASASAAILDTETIVLGGRVPKVLAERIIPHIKIFDDTTCSQLRSVPNVVVAEMQGEASSVGAAALPFKHHFFVG